MENSRFLSLIGLAYRAKKTIVGADEVVESLKSDIFKAVILASDYASDAERQIKNKCDYHHVPLYLNATMAELSQALGQKDVKAIGITDAGFASLIKDVIEGGI